jgi:hypothetical protein
MAAVVLSDLGLNLSLLFISGGGEWDPNSPQRLTEDFGSNKFLTVKTGTHLD